MSQKDSPIFIKGERVRDDFLLLFRQRQLACIVIIIAILLLSCIVVIETFRDVPALKSKTAGLQSELAQIKQDRDSKATEFGEVRRKADATVTGLKRDLGEARRDSDARIQAFNSQIAEMMAERGRAESNLAPWMALADSWYSNAPPTSGSTCC